MKQVILILLFFSSQLAIAQNCDLYKSFRQGFIELSEVAKKSQVVATAMKKTLKITDIGEPHNRCSATLVSKKGHILTASHCLEECRLSWPVQEGGKKEDNGKTHFIPKQYRKEKYCTMTVNGKSTRAKIIAMNPCEIMSIYDAVVEKKNKNSISKECAQGIDIALLEVDPSIVSPELCSEILWDKVSLNSSVAIVGYPMATYRNLKNIGDSDGTQVYGSFGQVVNRNFCNINGDPKNKYPIDKSLRTWRDNFKEDIIQTTTDVVGGNSGGPLIDSNGRIIAVTSGYFSSKQSDETMCSGSAVFSSVQGLEKSLANWGSDLKKEDLNCR